MKEENKKPEIKDIFPEAPKQRRSIMFYDFKEPWVDWAIGISKVISSISKHRSRLVKKSSLTNNAVKK